MSESHSDLLLPATELKQWAYCRRIVFYHQIQGIHPPMTRKMREALDVQEEFERLEIRRQLGKYGLEGARREFGGTLESRRLALSGKVDLLLVGRGRASVVDFKLTAGEPGKNHLLQLGAYGLLAEEVLGLPVEVVFFYRIPDDRLFPISLGGEERRRVMEAVGEIRTMLQDAVLPEATSVRGRCVECEYSNFCGDIW